MGFTALTPRAGALPLDVSGRILRPAVEYNVVDHCNLRCAGCDHAAPHLAPRFADPHAFAADIAALARHMHVRSLRLLGGEPLLHPRLDDFVKAAREINLADELMLWTNGLLLGQVPRALLESFDVIRVTVYPGIRQRVDLEELRDHLDNSSKTRLEVKHVDRFQHQILNEQLDDPQLIQSIYLRCKEAHSLSCHTVQNGFYYKCAKAPTLGPRLRALGMAPPPQSQDGVPLHGNSNLAEDLRSYLISNTPLSACAWCLGTDGKTFPHHQLSPSPAAATLDRTPSEPRDLIANPMLRLARDLRSKLSS